MTRLGCLVLCWTLCLFYLIGGMPLRGGVKQKMREDMAEDELRGGVSQCPRPPSVFLHKLWKKGRISSVELQEGASTVSDIDPNCAEWAKIGASGSQPSHCQRDLYRQLGKKSKLPELYVAKAPMWDHRLKKPVEGLLHFILPFEILANKVDENNVASFAAIPAGQEVLQKTLLGWCQRTQSVFDDRLLSLGVWGDSAPFLRRDSVYLMLWNLLSGSDHKRYWFTTFTKRTTCSCGCFGRHTFEVVWQVMKWCLEALQLG